MKYIKIINEANIIYTDDLDETEFLKMVKEQNPDLYNRFFSLVKNRGLEIAKEKYKEFDPIYQKQLKRKEKSLKTKEITTSNKREIKDLMPNRKEIIEIIVMLYQK